VWLLGRVGDAERVCRLQAAYEALGAGVGWEAYWTLPEGTNQQRQSALREGLGADAWNRGHDEGGSWSAQEALTYIAKALAKPD